jgi:hypothetical protein
MGLLGLFRKEARREEPVTASRQFSLLIAGFGVEVRPKLPAGIAQLADRTLIFGPINPTQAQQQRQATGRIQNVLIKPGAAPTAPLEKRPIPNSELLMYSSGEPGTTQLALGVEMTSYATVLDEVTTATHPAGWRLLTDNHEIPWPAGYTLRVDGDLDPRSVPYELGLAGASDCMLTLQGPLKGPKQIPQPEQLIAPYQTLVGRGSLDGTVNTVIWIELAYEHGGSSWRQRCYYLPLDTESVYLLRAQGTQDVADAMFVAADAVAAAFRPRQPGS